MFQCLIQFCDGQNVFLPPGRRLHPLHDSFKAIRGLFQLMVPTRMHKHRRTRTHTDRPPSFPSHTFSHSTIHPFVICLPAFSHPPSAFHHSFSTSLASSLFLSRPSLFFPSPTCCHYAVCIKRPVIHQVRVRSVQQCCWLHICQPSSTGINHSS